MKLFTLFSVFFSLAITTLYGQTYQQLFDIQDTYEQWSIEADYFTNHYYLASTAEINGADKIVLIKLDASGNQVWINYYDTPGNTSFKFGGIQMSNSRPDLIITGAVLDPASNLWKGLEMVISSAGAVNIAREYGIDSRNIVFLDGALNDFYSSQDEYYIGGYITDGSSDNLTTANRKSIYIRHDDNLNYLCRKEYYYNSNYGARNAINRISIEGGALAVSGLCDDRSLIDCTDLSDICLSPTRVSLGTGGNITITDNYIESGTGEYYFSGYEGPAHGQVIFSMTQDYDCDVVKMNNLNYAALTSRAFSMDKVGEYFYLAGYISSPTNNTFVTKYEPSLSPLYNQALSNNYSFSTTPFFDKLSFPDNLTSAEFSSGPYNQGFTIVANRHADPGAFDLIHVELDDFTNTCDDSPLLKPSTAPNLTCDPLMETTLQGNFTTINIERNPYSLTSSDCNRYYKKGNEEPQEEESLSNPNYYEVFSFSGKLVKKGTFDTRVELIKSLEKGVYLIRSSEGSERVGIF